MVFARLRLAARNLRLAARAASRRLLTLDGHALNAARRPTLRPRRVRAVASRRAHAELPEHLAQTQEGAQHRPRVVVESRALLPARDLVLEGRSDLGGEALGEAAA